MNETSASADTYAPFSSFEKTILRMLLIATVMLIGCLSACIGSLTVAILRFRYQLNREVSSLANDRNRDIEAAHKRTHPESHNRKAASSAAAIAERACDLAFERAGCFSNAAGIAPAASAGQPTERAPHHNSAQP